MSYVHASRFKLATAALSSNHIMLRLYGATRRLVKLHGVFTGMVTWYGASALQAQERAQLPEITAECGHCGARGLGTGEWIVLPM